MPTYFRLGLWIVGAILIVVAILIGKFKVFGNRAWLPASLTGIAGVGIIVWVLTHPTPVDPVQTANAALSACHDSTAPAVPDGATASLDQMKTAQRAFKAYDATINAYVHCVDLTVEAAAKQAANVAPADLQRVRSFGDSTHNAAIDREQAVVDKFNEQVLIYKAAHPAPQ